MAVNYGAALYSLLQNLTINLECTTNFSPHILHIRLIVEK